MVYVSLTILSPYRKHHGSDGEHGRSKARDKPADTALPLQLRMQGSSQETRYQHQFSCKRKLHISIQGSFHQSFAL